MTIQDDLFAAPRASERLLPPHEADALRTRLLAQLAAVKGAEWMPFARKWQWEDAMEQFRTEALRLPRPGGVDLWFEFGDEMDRVWNRMEAEGTDEQVAEFVRTDDKPVR